MPHLRSPCYPFVIYIVGLGQNEKTAFFSFSAQGKVPLCTYCSIRCRRDNNPPHESIVESDSTDRMSDHNHPKSHLHSITQKPAIKLKGVKHRISPVPPTS